MNEYKPTLEGVMRRMEEIKALRASVAHIALASCPFCGDTAQLRRVLDSWSAECQCFAECGACGPIRETAEAAAAAWNTRPTAPDAPGRTKTAPSDPEVGSAPQGHAAHGLLIQNGHCVCPVCGCRLVRAGRVWVHEGGE